MKSIKSFIANGIGRISEIAAKKAAGSASWGGFHQPKEPPNIKNYFLKPAMKK